MDFTYTVYKDFLRAIISSGYQPTTFEDYLSSSERAAKIFILRHDVDRRPQHSLKMARIQAEFGIRGTYYWRIVPESYNPSIIGQVVDLGHEIGYHYEDLALAKGNIKVAMESFIKNLDVLRRHYPISTICMHGSPLSKWDNRSLWKDFDYKDYDIIGEPYLDTDFSKVYYLTDTGRAWNYRAVSIRDFVDSSTFNVSAIESTFDLIKRLSQGQFPDQVMYNIHPERWHSTNLESCSEMIVQTLKNQVKKVRRKILK